MPKRGEARSRALKVRNTILHAHSAKADATSAAANSMCDLSATMEPTCLEAATAPESTATAEVTFATTAVATAAAKAAAAKSSSTAATVSDRPIDRAKHKQRGGYYAKYSFCFHTYRVAPAPCRCHCEAVRFCDASLE
jgi:hypothetical protein